MFPVLFTIGNLSISSFGFFLALAFLAGIFLVWRLSRAWELDEEKVLDLAIFTFLGGLIGARFYFVVTDFDFFAADFKKIFLILKYPGFSFWGGFLGGWLSLYFAARRSRLDFWHITDIASTGFLGGLVLAEFGCFLGSCSVGVPSDSFIAVSMAGFVGKRFPVQALESVLLLYALRRLWSTAIHFHPRGKIVSLALIYIGLIKLATNFFRPLNIENYIFAFTLIILGITIFYQHVATAGGNSKQKRTFLSDLKAAGSFTLGLFTSGDNRKLLLSSLAKSWYNQKAVFSWKAANINKFLRRIRVKHTRKEH